MDLWLRYERVGLLYRGAYSLQEDGRSWGETGAVEWSDLLRGLARNLHDLPSVGLLLLRTDHPFASPVRIPQETLDLFRSDPAEAIRQWVVEVDGGGASQRQAIPAGHCVLAGVFGERLYLSRDPATGKVESPFHADMVLPVESPSLAVLPLRQEAPGWYSCSTADLIASGAPRLFLPRNWNPLGWIPRSRLKELLDDFLTRKANANELSSDPQADVQPPQPEDGAGPGVAGEALCGPAEEHLR